jgi:hypothetical protein
MLAAHSNCEVGAEDDKADREALFNTNASWPT